MQVLDAATKIKMTHEEDDEDKIILKAILDVNLPKFSSDDTKLFQVCKFVFNLHTELKGTFFGRSESPLRINWCINNVLECTKFLSCCIYSSITIILGHYQGFIPLYSASSSWQKTSSLCNQGKNLNLFLLLFNLSKLIPWTGLERTWYPIA